VALIRIDGLHWTGRVEEATVVLERAEATVTEPAWRDELTFKRAQFAWYGGRTAEALALLEPLLDRLDGQALAVAHFIATYAFGQTGQTGAALAASDRGRAVHQTLTDIRFAWYPSVHSLARLRALVWAGRLGEAETLAARCYQEALAEEAEEPRSWFAWMLADCSRGQGRGETAIPWAREAVNIVRPLDRGIYFRNLLIVLAGSLVLAGKVDEAVQVISEIDGLSVPMIGWDEPDFIRVRAWVAVAQGDVATAKVLLEEAAASAARTGDRVYESGALHDLVRLGHAADVVVRLRELAEIVEGPAARARAAHAEALVARDPAGLEAVAAAFEGMPAFLLAAEATADAAVAWRKAGNPRKATAAEGRAHALAARCEGARTPALTAITARATLTPRELEIARLAAAGVDNKEIAGRLHLSRATVQNKLHAVYGKLGIAGRDELAHTLDQPQEGGLSPHP
jgi:ATP/maltotriose-dependent transcriptional regulator MalT